MTFFAEYDKIHLKRINFSKKFLEVHYGISLYDICCGGAIIGVLAFVFTVAAVVLLYIFVIPESKRETLPKAGAMLHDLLNFKELFLEKILKFFYVFTTVFSVVYGVLLLITFNFTGLIYIIILPIAIRVAYELLMMTILLVKNVIEINKKMK